MGTKNFFISRPTWYVLGVLIFLDAIAYVCYQLYLGELLESRFFRLGRDRGLFELIEYLKFYVIIALFWQHWKQYRHPVARAWAIFFSVMLVDNAVGLHEEIGGLLADYGLIPSFGLDRVKDAAEMLVMLSLAGITMAYVAWTFFFADRYYQKVSLGLVVLLGVLGAASVMMDALHYSFAVEEYTEVFGLTALAVYSHYFLKFKPAVYESK